jgi:hypothetical protein
MHLKQLRLGLLSLFLCVSVLTFGQGTDISINGYLLDSTAGKPLSGASVTAKNLSTGFSTTVATDIKGQFKVANLPVGNYKIILSHIGFQSKELSGISLNLGDRLSLSSIRLSAGAALLAEVSVTSTSFTNSKDRLGASTAITGRALQKLPLQTRNYLELATLSPLSAGNGAIGGTKPGGTGFLIDGVSNRRTLFGQPTEGAFPISLENVREFEVETNSYDVTNGRGSGGVVKAITKSGTNTFTGAIWTYYTANSLSQHTDVNGKPITSKYETFQGGASFSGPIIKNKLHFLVSYDQYQKTYPFRAYDFTSQGATQDQAEKNLGITKANLDSVISIMRNKMGFANVQQYGAIDIKQVTKNFMARFDWNINPKNLLTLRFNYQSFVDPDKLKGGGLLSTEYIGDQWDKAIYLSLRSDINKNLSNDLKINYDDNYRGLGFLYNRLPEGFVDVVSTFSDGSTNKKTVAFGNQNWVPEKSASTTIQLVDNLRLKVNKFSFVFGTDNIITKIKDRLTHDQQGQFYYSSLTDFTNNNPWRFNRKIALNPVGDCNCNLIELGAYAQMETDITKNITLTAGLRWDGTIIADPPAYNPLLEKELGLNNHVVPFDYKKIQPRVNITWDINGKGTDIIKFGAGLFASQFTTQAITFSHIDNGIDFRQVDARAPNGTIPYADWVAYQGDFSKVPGLDYYNSLAVKPAATITMMDKNLKTPSTFKTNLSYYKYLTSWLRVGANLYYNHTWNNFYLMDQNLKRTPEFVTSEGRGVYVSASSLSANSTMADYNKARISTSFNQVRMFTNTPWGSNFRALVLDAAATYGKGGTVSISYTRGKATGTPNYNAGDPRNANMNVGSSYWDYSSYGRNWYSNEDLKHKLVLVVLTPAFYGFTVSSSMIYYQSDRFSAMVNTDVNGDGIANDLAYVYDPNDSKTPDNIKTGMQALLQKTSPQYRQYLLDNMGRFAENNGGLMPWRFMWNMSIAKTINIDKKQKLNFRADIFNVLNLLNHEWGGYRSVINTNLYTVTGFDNTTNNWKYNVNTNAGTLFKNTVPYTIQLGVRYNF